MSLMWWHASSTVSLQIFRYQYYCYKWQLHAKITLMHALATEIHAFVCVLGTPEWRPYWVTGINPMSALWYPSSFAWVANSTPSKAVDISSIQINQATWNLNSIYYMVYGIYVIVVTGRQAVVSTVNLARYRASFCAHRHCPMVNWCIYWWLFDYIVYKDDDEQ